MTSPFYLWLWRSAIGQTRRFLMILLFIAAGVTLLQVTLTLNRALSADNGDQFSGDKRLLVLNSLSTQMPLPQFYQQKISALEGVGEVTWGVWVGAYFRHPGWFVPAIAIEDQHYFSMIPSLKMADGLLARWQKDRQGVLVDSRFAGRYKLKAGDRLPLSSSLWQLAPNPVLDLYITGIVTETQTENPPAVWMHYDYLENARQDGKSLVSYFMLLPKAGVDSADLSREVDHLFDRERQRGMTQTAPVRMHIKLFINKLFDFGRVVFWVNLALCLLLSLLLSTNFYVMTHKSLSEYRTLGYLGFSKGRIMRGVGLQLALMTLAGALAGMVISLLVIWALPVLIPYGLQGLQPHLADYAIGALVLAVLAVVSGLPSLVQIARQREEA